MKIPKDNNKLLMFGQNSEMLIFRQLEQSDFDEWLKFCEDKNSLKYYCNLVLSPQFQQFLLNNI